MRKKEFEKKCKKEGHAIDCKFITIGPKPGLDSNINVEMVFTIICPVCGATCTATGKWDNPID